MQPWPRAARPERDAAAPGLASLSHVALERGVAKGAEVPEQRETEQTVPGDRLKCRNTLRKS